MSQLNMLLTDYLFTCKHCHLSSVCLYSLTLEGNMERYLFAKLKDTPIEWPCSLLQVLEKDVIIECCDGR